MFTFTKPTTSYKPFISNTLSSHFKVKKSRFSRKMRRSKRTTHQRSKSSSEFEVEFNPRETLTKTVFQPNSPHRRNLSSSFSPPSIVDKLHDNVKRHSKRAKKEILKTALSQRKRQTDRKKREEALPPDPIRFVEASLRKKKSRRRATSFRGLLFKSEGATYFLRPKKYFVFVPHLNGGLYRVDLTLHDSGTCSNLIEKALQKYQISSSRKPPYGNDPFAYRIYVSENDGSVDEDFPSLNVNHLVHTYRCKFFVIGKNKDFGREPIPKDKSNFVMDDIRLKVYQNHNVERFHYVVIPPDLLVRDLLKVVCSKIGVESSSHHLQMFREKKKIEIPLELRYRTICAAGIFSVMLTKKYSIEEEVEGEDETEKNEKDENNLDGGGGIGGGGIDQQEEKKKRHNNKIEKKEQEDIEEALSEYPLMSKVAIDEFQYREYKVIKYSIFYLKNYLILGFDGKRMCCKYARFKKKSFWGGYNDESPVGMEKQIERSLSNLKRVRTFQPNHPKKFEIVFKDGETFAFDARTIVEADEVVHRLNLLHRFYKQERILNSLLERRKDSSNFLNDMTGTSVHSFDRVFE